MSNPIIQIQNVTKKFGSYIAVDDFSLDIIENDFFSLLGPSGCGKSTLLRMIAGFESPTSGKILIDGQDMTKVPPNKRPVNMVFQSYAVFPHMNVANNIAYGLKVGGTPRSDIPSLVTEALAMVRLSDFSARMPDQLSGGQRQRVALARALIKRPKVLLLDEPLSALDAKLRSAMQIELKRLQAEVGITFIVVTHDQGEALSLSSRMALMDSGSLLQVGRPDEIYETPHTSLAADFIGSVNLYDARIVLGGESADCPSLGGVIKIKKTDIAIGSSVSLAIRPEKLLLSASAPEGDHWEHVETKVLGYTYQGDHVLFRLELPNALGQISFQYTCRSRENFEYQQSIGKTAHIYWHIEDMMLFQNF